MGRYKKVRTIFATKFTGMNKWLIAVLIICGISVYTMYLHMQELDSKYKIAMANVKNYDSQLGKYKEQNMALQLTVSQLGYYQDSILKELDETRKKLKIKDKDLQSVHYVYSEFTKTDTLVLKDTIFKDRAFALDTVLGDSWYNVQVGLKYPSLVSVNPSFRSEKHIVVSTKKETVNPPKKFWLFRLFQKKHRVLKVNIIEKNPYVQNEQSEYIQIIK